LLVRLPAEDLAELALMNRVPVCVALFYGKKGRIENHCSVAVFRLRWCRILKHLQSVGLARQFLTLPNAQFWNAVNLRENRKEQRNAPTN
jgi:hypothetical protein